MKDAATFICNYCNKEYKSQNGLSRHTKICINEHFELKEKEIKELKEQIEILKSRSMKKPIQEFLASDCHNAKDWDEFMREIPIKTELLVDIGERGYMDCITQLLRRYIKKLSVYDRPLQYYISPDKNTLYVKTAADGWISDVERVREIIDAGFYCFDERLHKHYMKNITSLKEEVFIELSRNSSICKENEQQQIEIINMIIPCVKVGGEKKSS